MKNRLDVIYISSYSMMGVMFSLPYYYWNRLPETIPIHFNFQGTPDGWTSKNMIMMLPIIGVGLFALLGWVSKQTHRFNIPIRLTEANRLIQFELAVKLLMIIRLEILCIFSYIVWIQIQTAIGQSMGLSPYFPFVFLPVIFATVVSYYVIALKYK